MNNILYIKNIRRVRLKYSRSVLVFFILLSCLIAALVQTWYRHGTYIEFLLIYIDVFSIKKESHFM